jgi:uncharacterized membrane protein YbhN (UPF0104 family)
MPKNRWILWGAVCLFLLGLLYAMHHIHFSWGIFWRQLRSADPKRLLIGVVCIYLGYLLRAFRWALFLKAQKRVPAYRILGSQVIGFTAVALFGRLADLVRPYLVARRVQLTVSSQIGVYAVERMFDFLAMGLFFSGTLAFAPDRASLPHHEAFARAGYIGLAAAIGGGLVVVFLRLQGEFLIRVIEGGLGFISKGLAAAVGSKLHAFRDGLNVIASMGDFALALTYSVLMWGLISYAYISVVHSFVRTPELSTLTFSHVLLLMAASLGGSLIQLPVLGWFTTIAATAATMQKLLGVPIEPSIGCGALLLLVTFMSVIPVGLIYAQFEHVSLRKVTQQSEDLEARELGQSST